jgi:hypothetical protein
MATLNDPNTPTSVAAVKAASTAPVATDPALVVAISPNVAAGTNFGAAGTTAHDAAGSAVLPLAMGGFANAAAPTDVSADLDIVRAWFLRNGAQAIAQTFAGVLATTAASGVQRVGIVGGAAGANIDAVAGAAAPANVLYMSGRTATANPTNEANGDATPIMVDKAGRVVITEGHIRELRNSTQTAIAATTETTIVAAGGAGVFRDLGGLIITTAGAAAQTITIRAGTAGTVKIILNYPNAAIAPGGPLIIMFDRPLPALAANATWTAQQSVATSCNYTALWSDNL